MFAYSGTVSLSLYVWSYALSRRRAASPLSPISGLVVPAAEATLAVTGEITPNASSASASAARREHVRSAIFGRTPVILDHFMGCARPDLAGPKELDLLCELGRRHPHCYAKIGPLDHFSERCDPRPPCLCLRMREGSGVAYCAARLRLTRT